MEEQERDYDFKKLRRDVYQYIQQQLDLVKLRLTENTSRTVAAMVTGIIIFGLASLFFLFISIALIIFLGDLTGEMYYGFLIVGGIYFLLILLLLLLRKSLIERPVIRTVAKIFFEDEEDNQ